MIYLAGLIFLITLAAVLLLQEEAINGDLSFGWVLLVAVLGSIAFGAIA